MIYYKKHQRVYQDRVSVVIAMCDTDVIGKKLKKGKVFLDLDAYSSFYKGEMISRQEAKRVLQEFFQEKKAGVSFNLVGEQCVEAASGIIDTSKARSVAGVPHLQVYKV
ncbi:DUF424 family protein [Candidatus Micrarchaeota archaeon]|nr:DUF424 family protein [Candidatus Micrarchaeota archaeon]